LSCLGAGGDREASRIGQALNLYTIEHTRELTGRRKQPSDAAEPPAAAVTNAEGSMNLGDWEADIGISTRDIRQSANQEFLTQAIASGLFSALQICGKASGVANLRWVTPSYLSCDF
jgi:hypothetical protein